MLRQYSASIRPFVLELILAVISFGALLVVWLRDARLALAIPVACIAAIFFRKPSIIVYPITAVAFLRLDAWLSSALSVPFGKLFALGILASVSALVLLARPRLARPGLPLVSYALFLLVYFIFGSIEATGEGTRLWLEDSLYAFIYFAAVAMLVNGRGRLEVILVLIAALGAVASVVNAVEFLKPAEVALSNSAGRSAGLLKNANTAAFIVNVSFAASMHLLGAARTFRRSLGVALLQALYFIGVFTTFSREGLLVFAGLYAVEMIICIRAKRTFAAVAVASVLLAASAFGAIRYINTSSDKDVRFSFLRIASMVNGEVNDNNRLSLLAFHLERFRERPLTGYGLYSGLAYSVSPSGISGSDVPNGPHNTFALILSEAGVFPFIAYLVFLGVLLANLRRLGERSGDGNARSIRFALLVLFGTLLAHHFFSHMVFLERSTMVLFALFALPPDIISREN